MAEGWQNTNGDSPRAKAVVSLLTSLEQNDAKFLAGEIGQDAWQIVRDDINSKLAVVGLRLAVVK